MTTTETTTAPVPVTILTGFLGSGKTTLLNRILEEHHGRRIAVIENEFGAEGVDNDILVRDDDEQIIEMNNGCICCTVRGDLVRILGDLRSRRERGALDFERVIIETTGLADPAPVAQTFFVDENVGEYYLLDAIVTVVDAKHAPVQLDEHHEAQEQVGFADRILLSKTDLVEPEALAALRERLVRMNPRAPIRPVHFGQTPIDEILDVRGFSLDAILEIEPGFLEEDDHEHDEDVTSFVFSTSRPLDRDRLERFLSGAIERHGVDMLRYKGILQIAGERRRVVLQGVHMLMAADVGRPWGPDEPRLTKFVFIGRNLPKEVFLVGLEACVV